MGHLCQSHGYDSPHLCYSHAPKQHLEANWTDLYAYEWYFLKRDQSLLRSFIQSACPGDHMGSRWVHGEDFNYLPGTKIYNAIADMVLYQQVSRGLKVGIIVLLSLLSFPSFGRSMSVSIQIAHKNI